MKNAFTKATWKKRVLALVMVLACIIAILPQETLVTNAETTTLVAQPATITGTNAIWVKGSNYANNELDVIKWYYNSEANKYYLYLPTSADLSNLVVWHTFSDAVKINGTEIQSGMTTDLFQDAASGSAEYTVKAGNTSYALKVYKSNSTNTFFMTTKNGSLDHVNKKKGNKDSGTVVYIDENGNAAEEVLSEIKGRGNSSWEAAQKLFYKYPYNIKLGSKVKLFGMKKSKKWCLLANDFDQSLLRNKFVFDLAKDGGMPYTPEGELTDVYQNGRYIGNYLITSKVEVDSNRVDIYDLEGETEDLNGGDLEVFERGGDLSSVTAGKNKYVKIPNNPASITGGYLLEFELDERYCSEVSGFVTKKRQPVVLKTPEYASYEQVDYISSYFQEMENAAYSSNGYYNGKHYTEYLDLESAAKMFIIEELTMDNDAVATSFYMHKDTDDVFRFGPVWDFDWALGGYGSTSCTDTSLFKLKDKKIYNTQTNQSMDVTLMGALWKHDDFKQMVAKVWVEQFYPLLKASNTTIANLADKNEASANMNFSRFHFLGTTYWGSAYTGATYKANVDYVKTFVSKRVCYLNSLLPTYYTGTVQTPSPVTPTPSVSGNVFFDNSAAKWSNVYAYVWNNTSDAKVFAGTKVTDTIYAFDITGSYTKILFKNTDGLKNWNLQTKDLVMPTTAANCYKPNGTANKSTGSWYAYTTNVTPVPATTAPAPTSPVGTPTVEPTVTPTITPTVTPVANTTTVYYSTSWSKAYIHYKVNGVWTNVPGVPMTATTEVSGYNYKFDIDLGKTTETAVCFNNGSGSWDSKNGANYKLGVGAYGIKNQTITTLNLGPSLDLPTGKVKVYYNNSSFSKAYIHYKVNNGLWTSVPGVIMSASDNSAYKWMYTIDLGTQTGATVCFNNGSGSWDSKNGANYTVGTGTYVVNGGRVSKLN